MSITAAPVLEGWSCVECGTPTDEDADLCRDCLLDQHGEGRILDFDSRNARRGFTVVPNALLEDEGLSFQAKFLLITLMRYAWGKSDPYPGQERLAKDLGVGVRSVREYSGELVDSGYLKKIHRGQGQTTVYRIAWSKLESLGLRPAKSAGLDRQNLPPKKYEVEEVQGVKKENPADSPSPSPEQINLLGSDNEAVKLAWLGEDALIAHRPQYFERKDVADEIARAVRRHGREEVIAAIRNYAAVLSSDDTMWSHEWPCKEFLRRGVDRFVDDAQPFRQFARFAHGTGLTAQQILAMREAE
jgi:hypothetical protein